MSSVLPVPAPAIVVGGTTAVITDGLSTWKLVALVAPNLTTEVPLKWAPTSLTVEPPAMSPALGITLAMKPAAGVMGALAICTGGGPEQVPENESVPSVTLRLPA